MNYFIVCIIIPRVVDGIPLSSSLCFGDELAEASGGDEARPS